MLIFSSLFISFNCLKAVLQKRQKLTLEYNQTDFINFMTRLILQKKESIKKCLQQSLGAHDLTMKELEILVSSYTNIPPSFVLILNRIKKKQIYTF